jgi:hypothetical protein
MAVRTGAGTGVVVSLVVFVLTTVFLLVLTIVFYAGQTKEREQRAEAVKDLEKYARNAERNTDLFQAFEGAAGQERLSVAAYLNQRHEDLMQFVDGNPGASLDELQGRLAREGVQPDDVLRDVIADRNRDLRARQGEVDNLNDRLQQAMAQIDVYEADLEKERQAHRDELAAVESQYAGYADANEQYRQELDDAVAALKETEARLRSQYQTQTDQLESEIDALQRERVVLVDRINELESRVSRDRIRPQRPETLVDGRIIDLATNEQVFIDRGRRDRIVLGMTFEVYEDPASIRVNPNTGALPRGKSSLQVIKVGETTSTCKITRSVPGRPVVRNDVIANAVYDPEYKFKFLVHGKFDVDGDGRPSEAEAEYLRSQVIEWGGEVVTGDELPGDLDFLVLGVEPPLPPPLAGTASDLEIREYVIKREAHERYNALFSQAGEAQIPVLNDNRFFILIGYTER